MDIREWMRGSELQILPPLAVLFVAAHDLQQTCTSIIYMD